MPSRAPSLATLERWLRDVIAHPRGARAGVAARRGLERFVLPSQTLRPVERLDIYARMYQSRLQECLEKDYGALVHALGHPRFHRLAEGYVAAHPSRFYNLNRFGLALPEHLARQRWLAGRAFLVEVARLEEAMTEVFDAPPSAVADPKALAKLPPERWEHARFAPIAALRVLRFRYPANAYVQAVRDGKHPRIPRPRASAVAIYRKHDVVWRMSLTPPMATTLEALIEGKTLGRALERCLKRGEISREELGRRVAGWFREWVSEGVFAKIAVRAGA